MKYFLIFLLLIPFVSKSQTIFTKDQIWSTMHGAEDCDNLFCYSYYTKLGEDTIINEQNYARVLCSTDSLMIEWSLFGFLREEGKKVFYRKVDSQSDCLLYDFGCAVGDTLNLNCWCPENETKFRIDSIKNLPVMGTERKHIFLSYLNNSSTEIWIENIGSTGGFLNAGGLINCMTGFNEKLLCCSKGDVRIYQNIDYEDCYLGSRPDIPAQPIFAKEQIWSTMYGLGECKDFYCYSYFTKIAEDTLINDQIYSKVLNSNDSLMNQWVLQGYMREEDQKVFYRKKDSQTECLLYDFGCSIGDTLSINCWCPEDETKFVVDSIKLMTIMGIERKHIFLSYLNNSSTEIWIENIGSTGGFLNAGGLMNCMTGFNEELLCCSKDDVKIYQNIEYEGCYLKSGFIKTLQENKFYQESITIYPNPANEYINISAINSTIRNIELLDLAGNCLFQERMIDKQNFTLNINEFPPGVYLLRVETNEKHNVIHKVVFTE